MLRIEQLRNQKDKVIEGLKKRNWKDQDLNIIDQIVALDDQRKQTQTSLDDNLAAINSMSKQVGEMMKGGDKMQADELKSKVASIKEDNKDLEESLRQIKSDIEQALLTLPNVPHDTVDQGVSADDNFVYRDWTRPFPELGDHKLPHWELAQKYNLFDMKLGVKLTGSGFILYRGQGAKLQRALINYFLDYNVRAGYEEVLPPFMVNEASARGTGQLPDKEGQMYYVEKDDLYLIPTAEVPVTNILRDEILTQNQLPYCMTAYTPCFRREAGSYGAHVKGLNRVHQFDKVEIVRVERPEHSYDALEEMVEHVARLMDSLELPYRILRLCGGDMGFASAKTYDFEVWSAAQERWLEVSSVSNFETFQSNRLKLRYRDENNDIKLAHTLNGSSMALARVVAALLENNQTADGIRIPEVLRNFFGADYIN